MFVRSFDPRRLVQTLAGTEPFADYCRRHDIPFQPAAPGPMRAEDFRRWVGAVAQLSTAVQARLELDLAKVNDLAGRDANMHLLEAVEGGVAPPDAVPSGAPLALWFLLYQPD